jgi:outer membrane protein
MKKIIFITIILCSLNLSLKAQEFIDLNKALQIAIEKNPALSTIRNSISIEQFNIHQANGNLFPNLSLSGGWTRNITQTAGTTTFINGIPYSSGAQNSTQDNFNLGLSSQVVLFNGFANYQNVELENQNNVSLKLGYEKTRRDLIINIYQAFFDAVKKEKIIDVNRENLKTSQNQLEQIKEYVNVGKKTISDVYKQDVQVAQNELALEQSINDFDKAKVTLLLAMNDDINKQYSIDSKDIKTNYSVGELREIVNKSSNTDELVREAISSRYDYKSALQDIKINQIKLSLANKNLFSPSLSAFGNYNFSGTGLKSITDSKALSFGLTLSYPIFQGFKLDVSRQIAEVNIKQKTQDIATLEQQIRSDLKKAILDLQTSYKQAEILDRNIKSAEQDVLLSQENFRIGYGTLLDVQTATANLNSLYISRINSIHNFLFAKKQIEYLSGQLNF